MAEVLKTRYVSPLPELKDVADSEQQGRFDSVQFNSFSMREGFTDYDQIRKAVDS